MKRNPWILLIGAVFFCAFFYRQIFLGEVWYCCDNLLINVPAKVFLADSLKHGTFPLWNPYLFSGTPFFADLNLSLLHPFNLFYLFLHAFDALQVSILVLFGIALAGMFVLGRVLRLSPLAALAGAIVYGFSGSLVVYTNNLPILQVAVLIPWVMAVWIWHFTKPTRKSFLVTVGICAFQFISGHPQLTYYTWLMLLAYALILPTLSIREKIKHIFLIGVSSGAIAAVQLVPFAEFVRWSTRASGDFAFAAFHSVHPLSLVRLLLPRIVGVLNEGTAWVAGGTVHGYVGILPLLFFWFLLNRRIIRFFQVVSVAALFLALGKFTPVFPFREPVQFLAIFSFAMAVLTGLAVDELSTKKPSVNLLIVIKTLFVIVLIFLLAVFFGTSLITQWNPPFLPIRLTQKLAGLPMEVRQTITYLLIQNLVVIIAILGAIGLLLRSSISTKTKQIALVVLLFVDLFLFARSNLITINKAQVDTWFSEGAKTAQQLSQANWQKNRILVDPKTYPMPYRKIFGVYAEPEEARWQFQILRPDLGMLYGLSSVDGYASLVYRAYQQYLAPSSSDPTGIDLSRTDPKLLEKLGVRSAHPRFFFEKDGMRVPTEITVVRYKPELVEVKVNAATGGMLLFSDVAYPGWIVDVDGIRRPILRENGIIKGVALSAGTHQVVFSFKPASVMIGLMISLLGLVGTLAMSFMWKGEKRRLIKH